MKLEILDSVKLVVGTTNEIPIDLKCLIYRSDKDFDRVKFITEDPEMVNDAEEVTENAELHMANVQAEKALNLKEESKA